MTNIERYKALDKPKIRKSFVIFGLAALAILGIAFN